MPVTNDQLIRFACPQHVVDQVTAVAEADTPPGGRPNLSAAYRSLLELGLQARWLREHPGATPSDHTVSVRQSEKDLEAKGFVKAGPPQEGSFPRERPAAGSEPETLFPKVEMVSVRVDDDELTGKILDNLRKFRPGVDFIQDLSVFGCGECRALTLPDCPEHGGLYWAAQELLAEEIAAAQQVDAAPSQADIDSGEADAYIQQQAADVAEAHHDVIAANSKKHEFQGVQHPDDNGLETCAVCKLDEYDHMEQQAALVEAEVEAFTEELTAGGDV